MAEWLEKTLGEVTAFIAKGIPPKYTEEENENTIRVLNQKCNRNFEISYNESRIHDCEKKKVPVDKMLRAGDVLINSTGTGTAGRVAQMVEVTVPTTIDGHMILIRPSEELDPIYYGYAVKSFQSQIEGLAEGSTGQTEINRRRLQDEVIIRYPSDKLLQKNIGSFLANIDEKIKTNKEINNNLEQQAALLFDENYSNNNYNISTLEAVATIKYGKGLPTKKLTAQGFPVFGGNGVIGRYTHFMYEEPQVLVSCRGAASGKIMESYPNSFVTNNSLILEWNDYRYYEFYKQFLLANPLNSYATGSAQPQITIDNIKNVPIPYPNYDEISELCLTLRSISSLHYENVIENNKLANLRDTLLPHLMSGELDVSGIDR